MDVWTQYPHPTAGPGEAAWREAIAAWLVDWTHGEAVADGWAADDGPLVWPEFLEELEDAGLDLAVLPPKDHTPIKALFLEVYLQTLAAEAR